MIDILIDILPKVFEKVLSALGDNNLKKKKLFETQADTLIKKIKQMLQENPDNLRLNLKNVKEETEKLVESWAKTSKKIRKFSQSPRSLNIIIDQLLIDEYESHKRLNQIFNNPIPLQTRHELLSSQNQKAAEAKQWSDKIKLRHLENEAFIEKLKKENKAKKQQKKARLEQLRYQLLAIKGARLRKIRNAAEQLRIEQLEEALLAAEDEQIKRSERLLERMRLQQDANERKHKELFSEYFKLRVVENTSSNFDKDLKNRQPLLHGKRKESKTLNKEPVELANLILVHKLKLEALEEHLKALTLKHAKDKYKIFHKMEALKKELYEIEVELHRIQAEVVSLKNSLNIKTLGVGLNSLGGENKLAPARLKNTLQEKQELLNNLEASRVKLNARLFLKNKKFRVIDENFKTENRLVKEHIRDEKHQIAMLEKMSLKLQEKAKKAK